MIEALFSALLEVLLVGTGKRVPFLFDFRPNEFIMLVAGMALWLAVGAIVMVAVAR